MAAGTAIAGTMMGEKADAGAGTYTFSSQPRALQQRKKFRFQEYDTIHYILICLWNSRFDLQTAGLRNLSQSPGLNTLLDTRFNWLKL